MKNLAALWPWNQERFKKKGILFPLEDNDLTIGDAGDRNTSDIVYISDTCYSCILNSLNKRNPTASAVAEVNQSELENDNLGPEHFLGDVDGGDEAIAILHDVVGMAEI